MQIENPFESGHIKNYILLYASVVVIMVLFFIASTLFVENEQIEKKEFATEHTVSRKSDVAQEREHNPSTAHKFKLLKQGY